MKRRDFVRTGALAALGGALGCGRERPSGVLFKGWAYEPDLVRQNVEYFTRFSGIEVAYEAVSGSYHDKMVAQFVGGAPLDCCYVRDDDFAEWVEAGWLRPCDDLPQAAATREDMYPYSLEAMSYGGRQYGLPYYTDFTVWVYNQTLLREAGLEGVPRTLDEWTEQALKLKERRLQSPQGEVVEFPILLNFRQSVTGFNDWWALNYASQVELFDAAWEPIFPDDEGRRAERVLQWLVDGIHRHRIIDPQSLTAGLVRENTAAGRQIYALLDKYNLEWVNNRGQSAVAEAHLSARGLGPEQSRFAKVLRMAPIPALEAGLRGTLGWTRMYCLAAQVRPERLQEAWALMRFLGGRDVQGDYYTARRWFRLKGLGFAFRSLMDDPQIVAQTELWGDSRLIEEEAQHARTRENIKAPWFADFNAYYQAEIQKILLRQQSPREGLGRLADRCRALKKEWA